MALDPIASGLQTRPCRRASSRQGLGGSKRCQELVVSSFPVTRHSRLENTCWPPFTIHHGQGKGGYRHSSKPYKQWNHRDYKTASKLK